MKSEEVARRAYALYLSRGGQHGRDLDDWLTAERELRERQAAGHEPATRRSAAPPKRRSRR